MKIGSPLPHKKARIEIIPLIDIMFFLLASFMMASLTMIKLQSIKMDLPTARTASSANPLRGTVHGKPLSFFRMHWDDEPDWHPLSLPSPRKAGRGWPKAGRGAVHGKGEPPKFGRESEP